jgi:hypothetical protein
MQVHFIPALNCRNIIRFQGQKKNLITSITGMMIEETAEDPHRGFPGTLYGDATSSVKK